MDDFLALELNRRKDFLEKIVINKSNKIGKQQWDGTLLMIS